MANENASKSVRKPERIRGDKFDLSEYRDHIYFCDEMDPYIEQLESQLKALRHSAAQSQRRKRRDYRRRVAKRKSNAAKGGAKK